MRAISVKSLYNRLTSFIICDRSRLELLEFLVLELLQSFGVGAARPMVVDPQQV